MIEYKTIEELKAAFATGRERLEKDEYLKNGLPYCKFCGEERFLDFRGSVYRGSQCRCTRTRFSEEDEKYREQSSRMELNKRVAESHLGRRYAAATFENAVINANNMLAFEKARNYTEFAAEVFNAGSGLYICGESSVGKTYLGACILNELLRLGYKCRYVTAGELAMSRLEKNDPAVEDFVDCDFAFLDDVGRDFADRERDPSLKREENRFYAALNRRYNTGKPTVFLSGYALGELADKLGLKREIVDRIDEMAPRIITLKGEDFRVRSRELAEKTVRKLGI